MSKSKSGRAAREQPEVRRTRIIDEAIGVIGQLGYHGFTIQDLAARCGLSNAGLLWHFPSKEQLFNAVVEQLEQREIQALAPLIAAVEQAKGARQSLSAFTELLYAMLERGSSQPELSRLYAALQAESLDHAHPAHRSFQKREAAVLHLFTGLLAPHVKEPSSSARQLLALMDGMRLQWLRAGQSFDVVAECTRAVALLIPALAPLRDKHRKEVLRAVRQTRAPRTPDRRRAEFKPRSRQSQKLLEGSLDGDEKS